MHRNLVVDGQKLPISFNGSAIGYIGLDVLMYVSVITIIGWAWVLAAWMRWNCRNIDGTQREMIFNGSGLEILWRTIVFVIGCFLIIPIPWVMRWYTGWYTSQFALGRQRRRCQAWLTGNVHRFSVLRRWRTEPSCATEATNVPSGLKIMAAGQPAAALRARRILRVEQPFVGAERAVKPHRMIEAGRHHAPVEQRAAVARHDGIEQREVRGIGERAHVQRRVVGQFGRGADPDMDAAVVDLLAEIAAEFDRAQFDRTIGFVVAADEVRHLLEHRLLGDFFRRELFRRRHVRHFVLMIERSLPPRHGTRP